MVRMRINRSATRKRRSHHGLIEPRLSTCKDCGAKYLRHRACAQCGKYKGRLVEDIQAKNTKKAAKRIARIESAMQEAQAQKQQEQETKSQEPKAEKSNKTKKDSDTTAKKESKTKK